MIELPGGKGRYMLLEELILHYIGKVFKGYKVKGKSLIRVVRNADIDADALYDEDLDYREFMADLMKQRKKLSPVRLDMSREMDQAVIEALCRYLEITPDRVFKSEAPLDLSFSTKSVCRRKVLISGKMKVYWIRSGKKISSCLIPTNRSVRFLRC